MTITDRGVHVQQVHTMPAGEPSRPVPFYSPRHAGDRARELEVQRLVTLLQQEARRLHKAAVAAMTPRDRKAHIADCRGCGSRR